MASGDLLRDPQGAPSAMHQTASGDAGAGVADDRAPLRQLTIPPDVMTALCEYNWPGNVRELENVIERLVVTARREIVLLEDLPQFVRGSRPAPEAKGFRERRKTVADDLYRRVTQNGESFWTSVYPLYMQRKANVREVVRRGLEEARGNYKIVARIFNMGEQDYKRFLNFLRKHDCQLPFKDFR
jgi:DNA-binding NtrC family response regulator